VTNANPSAQAPVAFHRYLALAVDASKQWRRRRISDMQTKLNTAVYAIPGGSTVAVPDDVRLMTPFVLAEQGDWFEGEIHFIRRWLKPGMSVVDVGANYGLYTLTCAQLVGPEGHVWAYEPASLPRSFLTLSVANNSFGNVRIADKALSDHEGRARLGIAANAELNSLNEAGQSGEEVPLITLDLESSTWGHSIDFLKLDAEGEEVRILSCAKNFFARQHPLVMFEYKHGATVNQGLLQAISGLGMDIYRHLPGLNILVPMSNSESGDSYLLNVFGCDQARSQSLAAEGLLVPEVNELPEIDVAGAGQFLDDWSKRRPWYGCLWPSEQPQDDRPGAVIYRAAVAELIRSEEPDRSIADRLAHARRGFANLLVSLKMECNISRLLSAARAAMDLGERGSSVLMLREILNLLPTTGDNIAAWLPEPFLPPDHRHDTLQPGTSSSRVVLSAMIDEPLLERSAFSTYFLGEGAIPLLRRLSQNPLHSAYTERRISAAKQILPI
jgi:FkbM family methyltransferase